MSSLDSVHAFRLVPRKCRIGAMPSASSIAHQPDEDRGRPRGNDFGMREALERVERDDDLFEPVLQGGQALAQLCASCAGEQRSCGRLGAEPARDHAPAGRVEVEVREAPIGSAVDELPANGLVLADVVLFIETCACRQPVVVEAPQDAACVTGRASQRRTARTP